MDVYVFDVDGTLTPSRGVIDPTFKEFFNDFCRENKVVLVTGSDKPKTVEQIGEDTYNLAHTVYNCNGNDVWQGSQHCRSNSWHLDENSEQWLQKQLKDSKFPIRTGHHYDHRPGMCNFSIVGRNANRQQRAEYVEWDKATQERQSISNNFNINFPELEAKIGGETGIDISPKGLDKSQIVRDFENLSGLL